ncbi:alpha/beta fold hydrolase [Mycobacterium mantenii]|uniref:Alpha/beta hydrolase n=1 Tax=Mycobacterium mantenii TaxID=560555 RepID=A0A1X0FMF2_MYCNT|nr:alpha/beta fold hydrolase [Mycobacterium mantenii]ORB02891.1 alpha/beta hydrolase [Mycobacterium mantenii]
MIKADLVVDVSGSCDIENSLHIAATVFLPPPERLRSEPVVVFALPGGGYSRGYFDMHFDGHSGYSQVEHHVARGLIVVAVDYLGAGQSTPEICDRLTFKDMAAGNHRAVQAIVALLERGTAVPNYPPLRISRRIGMGHSMGAAVAIITAGTYKSYEGIAVLGFSAIHTRLPFRDEAETHRVADDIARQNHSEDPAELSVARTARLLPDLLYPFFWSDVPEDIVIADTEGGYPLRTTAPPFGSATLPNCVVKMVAPGFVESDAAAVECPVFIGLGERDTSPAPRDEPSAYTSATDITVFICERMAHMHNFASTRRRLWDRVADWCSLPTPPTPATN